MENDIGKRAIELHRKSRGKIEVKSKVNCMTQEGLSLAYTPGVAAVCKEIHKNPEAAYELTFKWNTVAIVSDGTRVLGLGDIGPLAALPVMEGKAALFKSYGNIDAFPICLATKDKDEIIKTVKNIAPVFGGINLEDIESPKCFEIEKALKESLDIPVFHDDQHGTAVVVLAGLLNALKVVGKRKENVKVVMAGAGAAGFAITKLLSSAGFNNILVCDSKGILSKNRELPGYKEELAGLTNSEGRDGNLKDAVNGTDVFIGAASPNLISQAEVKSMADSPIIFALSNPIPEIDPKKAKEWGAKVVGTSRADLPNQINNVLGFPGLFRGALLVRSKSINDEMKLAAATALADVVTESELNENFVVPPAFDRRIVPAVAKSVAKAAMHFGQARLRKSENEIEQELKGLMLL